MAGMGLNPEEQNNNETASTETTGTTSNTGNNSTLYQTQHKVQRTSGRIKIISTGESLPSGQYPLDFDELMDYMEHYEITVKETPDGLLFTGGTEANRERIAAYLNADVWLECNLRRYLNGTLIDVDRRKYVRRTKRKV